MIGGMCLLRISSLTVLSCAAALLCPVSTATRSVDPTPRVELLRVPEAGLQPDVAVDADRRVHLIYFSGEPLHGDVFYTRLEPDGRFARASRVNTQPGTVVATGNVRGAHLAVASGRVHVAWLGSDRARNGEVAPMLYTRSRPDGTFEPERNVHQNAGPIDGGSVAADSQGHVYVAWHSETPGQKGEATRRAWMARSTDEGTTFAPEVAASPASAGACGCCGTGMFADRRGTAYVLFRAARESAHRETVLLTSADSGSTFASQVLQDWPIAACPMSTYALSEGGGAVVAAWETAGQIYWASIDPSTRTAATPIAAPGDANGRKHPSIARNENGETLVAWTEGMGWSRGGSVAWQRFDRAGSPVGDIGRADGVPAWSLVSAFVRPDGRFAIIY